MVLTRITNYMQGREGIRICISKNPKGNAAKREKT
jgi:hypothetical protein